MVKIQKFEVKEGGALEAITLPAMYNTRDMKNSGVTGVAYSPDDDKWDFVPVGAYKAATFHVDDRGTPKRVVAYSRRESSGRNVVWVLRNAKMDELDK